MSEKEHSNKQTKWTPEYVQWLQALASGCVSLNQVINVGEDGESELGEFIPDPSPGPDELCQQQDRHNLLVKYIEQYLKPREQIVITMRFGLEDGKQRTLEEIGEYFGVTRERIRQVEQKALRKLRNAFSRNKIGLEDI